MSGAELMQIAPQLPPTALAVASVLLPGMSLIGIEVIASANRQIARPDELGHRHQHGRVPDLVWSADRLGAAGGFRRDASQFSICDCSFPRRRVIGWLFAAVVAPESPDCGAIM